MPPKQQSDTSQFINSGMGKNLSSNPSYGSKGNSLISLVLADVPVPSFFIIPATIFTKYTLGLPFKREPTTLTEIQELIKKSYFSKEIIDEITKQYKTFSRFGKALVSVRSSIVINNNTRKVTFAGQLPTFLNVRGVEDIEKSIKEIYATLFSSEVSEYIKANHLQYTQIEVAIAVQQMVQAEVSGVMYTIDPVTMNNDQISIEAVFGLGDVIASGEINPDLYTVEKASLSVIEKKIVPQKTLKVRRISGEGSISNIQQLKISRLWQYSQKLEESVIVNLASLGKKIATNFKQAQHIEWVYESGKIWILQTRDYIMSNQGKIERSEKEKTIHLQTDYEQGKQLLLVGTGVNNQRTIGKALIVSTTELNSQAGLIEQLKDKITKDTILVIEDLSKPIESLIVKSGGVISNYGGTTSDLSVIARELNIPAVVGARVATSFIKNGDLIYLDGATGGIYKISEAQVAQQIKKEAASVPIEEIFLDHSPINNRIKEVQEIDSLPETELISTPPTGKIDIQSKVSKLFFSNVFNNNLLNFADGVNISASICNREATANLNAYFKQHQNLREIVIDVDASYYQNNATAFNRLIQNIKRLSSFNGTQVITLNLAKLKSVSMLLDVKRLISSKGVRRSKNMKIYVSIDSPLLLELLPMITDTGIDGLIFSFTDYYQLLTDAELTGLNNTDFELLDRVLKEKLALIHNFNWSLYTELPLILTKDTDRTPLKKFLQLFAVLGSTGYIIKASSTKQVNFISKIIAEVEKTLLDA